MRELTLTEMNCVSGGATMTEYIILLYQPPPETQSLNTQHDTAKAVVGNIR